MKIEGRQRIKERKKVKKNGNVQILFNCRVTNYHCERKHFLIEDNNGKNEGRKRKRKEKEAQCYRLHNSIQTIDNFKVGKEGKRITIDQEFRAS